MITYPITGDNSHHKLISKIVSQFTPNAPPNKNPMPMMAPIVAWVVEIGSPRAEDAINHIAVEIKIVNTTAFVTVNDNKSFPTVSLTAFPRSNAPNIANITARINNSFMVNVLEPYNVAIVSSFAPIPKLMIIEITKKISIIYNKAIFHSTLVLSAWIFYY